jgi:hypothetical protein
MHLGIQISLCKSDRWLEQPFAQNKSKVVEAVCSREAYFFGQLRGAPLMSSTFRKNVIASD